MKTQRWIVVMALSGCTRAPAVPPAPERVGPRPVRAAATPAASATASSSTSMPVAVAYEQLCAGPRSIPLEVAGSRHFVQIPIVGPKGTDSLRFHVDTGGNTPGLALLKSVADRLGFVSAGDLPKIIRLGDRDIALPRGASWLLIDDVSAQATNRAVTAQNTRKAFSTGQIGAGFLSRFVVCLDPARGRLGLGDPADVRIDRASAPGIPLMMLKGGPNRALYPFVQILIRHENQFVGGYGVLLDTGATTSMLDANKIEYLKQTVPSWPFATVTAGDADMIGGQFPERMLQVEEVVITAPKATFPSRPEVSAGPALFVERPTGTFSRMFGDVRYTMGSHGAIANDVLNRYRMLIDYPGKRLWLESAGTTPSTSASMNRVGVALRFGQDGCPSIRGITDTNAPETVSALRLGDVLLAIDGRDACPLWHHEIAAELAGEPGRKKKLKLRRGSTVLDVEVPATNLLR